MPIQGAKELSNQLKRMAPAAGGKALRSAALAAMLPVLREAQASIPVRTEGGLKRTYKGRLVAPGFASRNVKRSSFLSRDKTTAWASVGVAKEAFYAINFYEFGTSRQPKRPWLEPAFKRSIPAVTAGLTTRLKKLIDKAAKR